MHPSCSDGLYYITIANIPPATYTTKYMLMVNNDYSLTYQVNSYIADAVKNEAGQNLKELVGALYRYGVEAESMTR